VLEWFDDEDDPRDLSRAGKEVWKRLMDERYAVSNLGRMISFAQDELGKEMTQSEMASGYIAFNLPKDTGGTVLAHRTVLLAFDGPPPTPQHRDVRHLDGNKSNNRLDNLLWGTRSENMLDVLEHKKRTAKKKEAEKIVEADKEGTWFGGRTWDTDLVETVLRMEADKRITVVEAAELLGVSRHTVQNILLGRTRTYITTPPRKKQKRRTEQRKNEIMYLALEGKNAREINDILGEDLTPQALYYYKVKAGG